MKEFIKSMKVLMKNDNNQPSTMNKARSSRRGDQKHYLNTSQADIIAG